MPLFRADHEAALYYEMHGQGDALVLIHGLGSSGADWALQFPAFAGRFRVIVPDLPGSGRSDLPQGELSVATMARSLWRLLEHLQIGQVNLVGFSLGGAVALEMAIERPGAVKRLALINSLASYRIDHWRKWFEALVPAVLIRVAGMRCLAWITAARLFPRPWQKSLRDRAVVVVSEARADCYFALGFALQRWSAADRLGRLAARTLIIAAEFDYTPVSEKRAIAAAIGADFVVIRGSRHGTPFDSVRATNECLLALMTDQALPPPERWVCDGPSVCDALPLPLGGFIDEDPLAEGTIAES